MHYFHCFVVAAPLSEVEAFHARSASMAAITPPPIRVQMHAAPQLLQEGDLIDFTLWLGPIPLRWLARIEQRTPISFVDQLIRGPFRHWQHYHAFVPVDTQHTAVVDWVEAVLHPHWFWRLVGWGMWRNLPLLFAYRAWRTRWLLTHVTQLQQGHGEQ